MQKTNENLPKSHPKSMPKGSKNLLKTDAKKNVAKRASALVNPGPPAAPVRGTKRPTEGQQKADNLKEGTSERHERPTSTL